MQVEPICSVVCETECLVRRRLFRLLVSASYEESTPGEMAQSGSELLQPSPKLRRAHLLLRATPSYSMRVVPLGSFFVLPAQDLARENVLRSGEIITHITLPPLAPGSISSYRKVRARGSWDFALAGLALALKLTGRRVDWSRVVLSGVA